MKEPRIQLTSDRLKLNYDTTLNGRVIKRNATAFYKDIERITIEYCREKVRFNRIYQSERIIIRTKNLRTPIVYYGIKEFEWFDNYKDGLRKFAVDHNIELIDEVLT